VRAPFFSLIAVLAACAEGNANPPAVPPLTTASVAPHPVAAETPSFPEAARALRDAGLRSRGAAQIVKSLTTEVGPRLAGSANDARAVEWAKKTMEAAGLANVHAEPVTVQHWERGEANVSIVGPRKESLDATALGTSVATPEKGIVAEVLEVDSLDALEKLSKDAAKGKIVFINKRMRKTKTGEGYGEAVGVRFSGAMRAASHGALAVVIRSVGTDDAAPHTGAMAHPDGDADIPAAALSGAAADALHDALEKAGRGSSLDGGSRGLKLALKLTTKTLPNAESANVVGDVVGRERPEEIVLLGAHLDSWDLATGALDDGAGCGIVLEAARLLLALPAHPRRTVRVVLFASEEYGGLPGAKAYAKAHETDLGKHVVAMEADLGGDRAYALGFLGASEAHMKMMQIAAELAPLGIDPSDREGHGGSDTLPLRKAGVPVFDLAQDATRYFDVHHSRNDTFDRIDPEAIAQVATAYAVVAWAAAEAESDFGRIDEQKRREMKW
jgi:Zn-dependent M28 family amino/carboxypeptidase